MRKLFFILIAFIFSVQQLFAQTPDEVSAMETNGKIYVVLAVCLTIFAGIVAYLIRIDRKLSKLEKQND